MLNLPDFELSEDVKDWAKKLTVALQEQFDPDALRGKLILPGMIVLNFDADYDVKAWLPCDGATYNSEDFPLLAKALGIDTPTFVVPDLTTITADVLVLVKT